MEFPKSYLCATREYNTNAAPVPAPYFRKNFTLDGLPARGELCITGIGIYEVYLNGENITKGYLAPYRSNPRDMVYFDLYDVTAFLRPGKNVIGVILGNGLANSNAETWQFSAYPHRAAPKTAFSLTMDFGEKTEVVLSDLQTKIAPSPIVYDDFHFGEYYDARREIPGWNLPEFDDAAWAFALSAEVPFGEPRLCEAEPIVKREEIKPLSVTPYEKGYVYDFGVNSAGLCRLKLRGERGQKILLQYFETLWEGKPYLDTCRFAPEVRFQEDEYTLKGEGVEEFTPRFTYHGFRYVLVTGITEEQATQDLLTYLVLSSDLKIVGEFRCSDGVVNKIQEATVRSDLANFYYFPTDCPQREKHGWTADASLSAEQMLLNLTPEHSYREWMRNIYKAMRPDGMLPGIVPTLDWGYEWGNGPGWDNVIVNLPYHTYLYRGDVEILREVATPLLRYLNYLLSRRDERGLLAIGLGDWCQPDRSSGSYTTPLAVTDTVMAYDIAKKAAFIYDVLEMAPQKVFAETVAEGLRKSFRAHLIDFEKAEVFGQTQTAQAIALYYGMFAPEEEDRAFEVLLDSIEKAGRHMDTGVLGGRILFRLLADRGYGELAYEMITLPDHPSYGSWIADGATSLWERFYKKGPPLSLNHHFWGDVSAWFYRYLGGIRVNPFRRDCSEVSVAPEFIQALDFVSASHTTPHGKISVDWHRTKDGIILEIAAAPRLHGRISLPRGFAFADGTAEGDLVAGTYQITRI